MTLTAHERAAKSGNADSLIVFVHGYGADGADLLGLADPLGQVFPSTAFVAPDAPAPCQMNPMGFQWFPIPWLDGSDPIEAGAAMQGAFEQFDQWLNAYCEKKGIAFDRVILLGFSQGTMMSLSVGLRQDRALAGIVGFSGRLLEAETLAPQKAKPPVQLIHGDHDDVVPYDDMRKAEHALASLGYDVATHTMQGTGHGISPDGLEVAAKFIAKQFG